MYFAILRSDDGQYWWRAVGDNNEIMAASELLTTKQSAERAIGRTGSGGQRSCS